MAGTVESVWKGFWKDIVTKNGEIDLERIKRELFDFYNVMQDVPRVYDRITNGKMSYITYKAEAVLQVVEEARDEDRAIQKQDDI